MNHPRVVPFTGKSRRRERNGHRPVSKPGLPPWAVAGASALLLFSGFGRRPNYREEKAHDAGGDPNQHRRGRQAEAPSEVPLPGWRDVFVRIYHNLSEDRVVAIAAGCTFYALLAIFPGIAALISIYGLFADPQSISQMMESLDGVLPSGALDILGGFMKTLTEKPPGTLGLTFAISLALSLWSANSGLKALFDALNVVYHEKEKRSFFKLNAISLGFTVAATVLGVVVIAAIAIVPPALKHLPLGNVAETVVDIARWPVLLIIVAAGLAAIYRYGPSRETAKWQWLSWGGGFAAILWVAASMLFSWYSAQFGSYDKTYGSLGAVIVFMTWIWISAIVVLLGAELNAELEHQTARDTTTGQERPLGTRGAYVADTVGASH